MGEGPYQKTSDLSMSVDPCTLQCTVWPLLQRTVWPLLERAVRPLGDGHHPGAELSQLTSQNQNFLFENSLFLSSTFYIFLIINPSVPEDDYSAKQWALRYTVFSLQRIKIRKLDLTDFCWLNL